MTKTPNYLLWSSSLAKREIKGRNDEEKPRREWTKDWNKFEGGKLLLGTIVTGTTPPGTNLTSSTTQGTSVTSFITRGTSLISSTTQEASLTSTTIPGTSLTSSTMQGTSGTNSIAPGTSVISSTTQGTILTGSISPGTSMSSSNSTTPSTKYSHAGGCPKKLNLETVVTKITQLLLITVKLSGRVRVRMNVCTNALVHILDPCTRVTHMQTTGIGGE